MDLSHSDFYLKTDIVAFSVHVGLIDLFKQKATIAQESALHKIIIMLESFRIFSLQNQKKINIFHGEFMSETKTQ